MWKEISSSSRFATYFFESKIVRLHLTVAPSIDLENKHRINVSNALFYTCQKKQDWITFRSMTARQLFSILFVSILFIFQNLFKSFQIFSNLFKSSQFFLILVNSLQVLSIFANSCQFLLNLFNFVTNWQMSKNNNNNNNNKNNNKPISRTAFAPYARGQKLFNNL